MAATTADAIGSGTHFCLFFCLLGEKKSKFAALCWLFVGLVFDARGHRLWQRGQNGRRMCSTVCIKTQVFTGIFWCFSLTAATTDLEKRIADAFLIFDHQGNKTVDVREIGTILRYLGVYSVCIIKLTDLCHSARIVRRLPNKFSNALIQIARFEKAAYRRKTK